ncbi:MAG TPA: hypothetical protein VMV95_03330 [Bacillota bacterium]|nr:hypothetical protein [Bacillota bacterium]
MNLTKIVITNVRANEAADFIRRLEELPKKTIQGEFNLIEAYQGSFNKKIIKLSVSSNTRELKKVKFKLPKNAKIIKKSEYGLEFQYNGRHYELRKEFEGECFP